MCKIGELRKIVTEIHSAFPQGLRKACREAAFDSIHNGSTSSIAEKMGNRNLNYPLLEQMQYYFKIKKQETEKVINKLIKESGISIQDISVQEINAKKKMQILKGLSVSKTAGLELPEVIEFKKLNKKLNKKHLGEFSLKEPNKISIDSSSQILIDSTTIHELLHKKDLQKNKFRSMFLPCYILDKIVLLLNYKTICRDVSKDALKNRTEFVAYTGEKLLYENKNWNDLHPKMKSLYKFFKGPEIKLNAESTKLLTP